MPIDLSRRSYTNQADTVRIEGSDSFIDRAVNTGSANTLGGG
jgi:hypothetical protein